MLLSMVTKSYSIIYCISLIVILVEIVINSSLYCIYDCICILTIHLYSIISDNTVFFCVHIISCNEKTIDDMKLTHRLKIS